MELGGEVEVCCTADGRMIRRCSKQGADGRRENCVLFVIVIEIMALIE